jgi:dTDP-4-dehydrorhamnose 3,5-epimerase
VIEQTSLPDVYLIKPRRFADGRGFFSESWNSKTLREAGLDLPEFVQDNHSFSTLPNTIRALHFQSPPFAQGKLVRCGRGRLFDVAVDFRKGSPTFGKWFGTELSFENGLQLWIPAGFLHGFQTLEPDTEVIYKCTKHYAPECDQAIAWDSAGVEWKSFDSEPALSDKDKVAPPLESVDSPFEY